ncbi:hypothetical protein CEXT_270251 [Caerostris extrusa]|uniref:Uncharacterized protein n=1 Tax=Caerostris extrusa TaxID=172846 RepID=A0AAV4THJ2_CAEEX|nr:hypothetical protein CEXT_270251 [Caerostris extrusa]
MPTTNAAGIFTLLSLTNVYTTLLLAEIKQGRIYIVFIPLVKRERICVYGFHSGWDIEGKIHDRYFKWSVEMVEVRYKKKKKIITAIPWQEKKKRGILLFACWSACKFLPAHLLRRVSNFIDVFGNT